MSEWKDYKLSEISRVINGRAYSRKELLENGKYPVLRVGNFFTSNKWYYSDLELPEEKYCFQDDLLYAWSASFGPKIWRGAKTIYHYHIWKLETNDKVNKIFLYYWLLNSAQLLQSGTHGSVMGHLTKTGMEQQKVNLPDLPTQKAIAEILSSLDDKIELNNKINENLESLAQTIFKRWFVDFEFPDENGNPYKSSGGKMVESEMGLIPEGWEQSNLGSVLELAYGKALKKTIRTPGPYPVVGSSGIVDSHKDFFVEAPGIVIGRKGTIGEVIWLDSNFYPIDTTFYIKDSLKLGMPYLYFLLKEQDFKKIAADSAVPGLNRNEAYKNLIAVPPNHIANSFTELAFIMFESIEVNNKETKNLIQLRDTLLPRLITGKLEISQTE